MKLSMEVFIAEKTDWHPHSGVSDKYKILFWKQTLVKGEEDNMKTSGPWVGGEGMMDCRESVQRQEADVVDVKSPAAQF